MNKQAVVVLAPNGRRQTVRVNPNSTILQILEEVCNKQGLQANEYDIKHHNKCLDTSTIFRFSGLPNNAQLELAQATKTRSEGIVTMGVQLENGERLMGTFSPSSTVWEVLMQLCPEETKLESNLIVIYMRSEIYSKALLSETTLRSLGLTSGRAMLRVIHRSPEELKSQANVSTLLPAKPVEEKPYLRTLKRSSSPPESEVKDTAPTFEDRKAESSKGKQSQSSSISKQENFATQFIKSEKQNSPTTTSSEEQFSKTPTKNAPRVQPKQESIEEASTEKTVAEEDFIFLGARNAMLFSQETAQAIRSEDLPDDFFELTIHDAKKLLRDIKRRRLEFENARLQTSALRNLEQSKRELTSLNRYKQAIIRVTFPDHTVLQGTFTPTDTVEIVEEFVREYLENKSATFYLYTTPPKNILKRDRRLIEIECVPNAILYYGSTETNINGIYLRADLMNKFTTQSIASLAAAKMRKEATRKQPEEKDNLNDELVERMDQNEYNVGASTSKGPTYEDYPARPHKETEKVPKWFKPT